MAILGSGFYPKLVQLSSEVGMKPEDILAIMTSESGISPSAHNANGNASGLMQFMPSTLPSVGFKGDHNQFRQLSGEQQLPYIKNYIENQMQVNGGPFTSAAQYYVAVFWPVGLKLAGVKRGDPSTPIVEENPRTVRDKSGGLYSKKYYDLGFKIDPGFERKAYQQNPLFHGDTPGAITYGDMMRQVDKNKRNPLYSRALLAMQNDTGYQAGSNSSTMVAQKTPTAPAPGKENFYSMVDRLLEEVSVNKSASKKMYKKLLPIHDILIKITAPDYTSATEFSRVLCAALDEELLSNSYPHTDGAEVEVECSIPGPLHECFATVSQLTGAMAQAFKTATSKIGGIEVQTCCLMNKKSSYQQISLRTADTQYRKFLLKFM